MDTNIAKNLCVQAELAVRDERMRATLIHRRSFYEHLTRLASANMRMIEAFEYVRMLKPGENDYGRCSILSHYPEIIADLKERLRISSELAFGTRDFGSALEADKYE
jgi:hypothetical protein